MASAVGRAYNGGLGRTPQRVPGAEPLVVVRGLSPLKLKAFCCETSQGANLAHFWEKSNHTFGFGGCQVYFRLFGVSKMTAKLTYLHRI